MKKDVKILNKAVMYNGFFKMEKYHLQHTLFAGGWSGEMSRELFVRGNCVAVVLYDAVRDEVILIEQFRVGAIDEPINTPWLIEIVAGIMEENETPVQPTSEVQLAASTLGRRARGKRKTITDEDRQRRSDQMKEINEKRRTIRVQGVVVNSPGGNTQVNQIVKTIEPVTDPRVVAAIGRTVRSQGRVVQ
jgi:hypothetical protein